jgi:hypothetical protein
LLKTNPEYLTMKQKQIIDGFQVTTTLANSKKPEWSNGNHNHYKVKIAKDRKSLSFDFFGSMADFEKGIHPTIKEALYCFALDCSLGKQSFKDFCADMGASTDSIHNLKMWRSCVKSAKNAERVGIPDEVLEAWGMDE